METKTNLGRVSLVPRGEYDPSVQYTYLDLVRYDGSGYLVLRPVQGVAPVDGADYMLITEKGGKGDTGATGPQGEQGIQGIQGEKGERGDPGSSIASIERTAGTGAPGTRDTYTITLTDGSTSTIQVYNGADGTGAGDMTQAVYDPQGKAQDIFQYVDDYTKDAVTTPGGGEIEMEEGLGEGPYTFEFTADDEGAVSAAQVSYDGAASGVEAENVQGAIDALSVSVSRVSNENLLDNWYFPDPINQRGQTEYTGGYGIDRWLQLNGIVTINQDCITLKSNSESGLWFQQNLDIPRNNEQITASVLVDHIQGECSLLVNPAGEFIFVETGITSITTSLSQNTIVRIHLSPNSSVTIKAIKLEFGPVQTLAHQDASGNWVLNDPTPNKALELLKCQRYARDVHGMYPLLDHFVNGGAWFYVPCPNMRVNPVILDFSRMGIVFSGTPQTGYNISQYSTTTDGVIIQANNPSHNNPNIYLSISGPTIASADL